MQDQNDDAELSEALNTVLLSALQNGASAFEFMLRNSPQAEMDQAMTQYDKVIGVWRDLTSSLGFGFLFIKGVHTGAPYSHANSIPCIDREMALRLQARYGDADDAASNSPAPTPPKVN